MLEVKLWHNKTETKNVKIAKTVEFIKTCDHYLRRFNFLLLIGQYVYYNCLLTTLQPQKKLKLTMSFLSSRFATRSKSQDENLNILRTKRAFDVK